MQINIFFNNLTDGLYTYLHTILLIMLHKCNSAYFFSNLNCDRLRVLLVFFFFFLDSSSNVGGSDKEKESKLTLKAPKTISRCRLNKKIKENKPGHYILTFSLHELISGFQPLNEILWCDHSNENSSAVRGTIYLVCRSTLSLFRDPLFF